MKRSTNEAGYLNPLLIPLLVSIFAIVCLGGFGLWSFVNYSDQKNNVDQIATARVKEAEKNQAAADEKKYLEQEKLPTRKLIGPDDLGRVQLDYPKTWSVYLAQDGAGRSAYEAFLYPSVVPPIENNKTAYALRVSITDESYDSALSNYSESVKKGDLKSTPISIEGITGNRLDGTFNEKIEGSMVIFKVRDKTLRVYTQAPVFRNDFDNIILKSLKFNP